MESFPDLSPELESETQNSSLGEHESTSVEDEEGSQYDIDEETRGTTSFLAFRLNFLFVTLVVMLADGLQGVYYVYDGIDTMRLFSTFRKLGSLQFLP